MDRSGNQAEARFTEWVEAVRVGTIFAQDQKQYERWNRSRKVTQKPMPDDALLAEILRIGNEFPGNVVRGTL